ncbi:hypothetical protein LCGC14_2925000 [marine sediment metagenome]|uniref:Uncharacterized protein n=1 Tax=marine sediment metagenome TaxID=412755 RepID=A0A0F8XMY1_9ZZZZ
MQCKECGDTLLVITESLAIDEWTVLPDGGLTKPNVLDLVVKVTYIRCSFNMKHEHGAVEIRLAGATRIVPDEG